MQTIPLGRMNFYSKVEIARENKSWEASTSTHGFSSNLSVPYLQTLHTIRLSRKHLDLSEMATQTESSGSIYCCTNPLQTCVTVS